jgi:AraC-like DNA-binding protein
MALAGDQAIYSVVPELDGTEALAAVYRRHRFKPHFHETFLIGVTEGGAELFEARGERHLSPALSLRFLNPGEVHTGEPPEGAHWSYRCLYPRPQLVEEVARELTPSVPRPVWFPNLVVSDHRSARMLLSAFATLRDPTATALERSTLFRTALAVILALHTGGPARPLRDPGREPRAIARAAAFIGDHAERSFDLKQLAAAAGLSPFHLTRTFKARTGLTPFAYQAQVRVERAKDALRRGEPVNAVAIRTGFCDSSHLARVFRAHVGLSPREYRAAALGSRTDPSA